MPVCGRQTPGGLERSRTHPSVSALTHPFIQLSSSAPVRQLSVELNRKGLLPCTPGCIALPPAVSLVCSLVCFLNEFAAPALFLTEKASTNRIAAAAAQGGAMPFRFCTTSLQPIGLHSASDWCPRLMRVCSGAFIDY